MGSWVVSLFFFFFQAEDGIRDLTVTGVQTCALPIWSYRHYRSGTPDLRSQILRRDRQAPRHYQYHSLCGVALFRWWCAGRELGRRQCQAVLGLVRSWLCQRSSAVPCGSCLKSFPGSLYLFPFGASLMKPRFYFSEFALC